MENWLSGAAAYAQAKKFLESRNVHGTILFATVIGSHQYGLAHPASDVDFFGVYVADTMEYLSIDPSLPTAPLGNLPNSNDPDIRLYEAKQFVQYLLKGNPFAIEVLFAERFVYKTNAWVELQQLANEVINAKSVQEYLDYITGQIQRHKAKPLVGKRIYHVIRLLYELDRIIEGKPPKVCFNVGTPEYEYLQLIRSLDDVSALGLVEKAEKWIEKIVSRKPWSNIKSAADEQKLSEWLIRTRICTLHNAIVPVQ